MEKNIKKDVIMIKKFLLASIFLFIVTISVIGAEAQADWTRAYCLYNGGSGGYACDSGQVAGDTASCSASNGVQCTEEGWVYCYAQSYCTEAGTTNQGPVVSYEVTWDADQADCTCRLSGLGLPAAWNVGFESGTTASCCGDDVGSEFYRTRVCGSWCSSDPADNRCCNTANKCVYGDTCYSSASCYSDDAYCNAGTWYNSDDSQTYCDACLASGRWNIGGEVAATACCGDDSGEFYQGPGNSKSCDGTDACCDSSADWAQAGICVPSCGAVDSAYWTNMINQQITTTDLGDTLMAVAETSNAEGKQIDFALWEEPGRCYDADPYGSGSSSGGSAYVLWQAQSCGGNQFKFKASMNLNPAAFQESGLITVSPVEDNYPPVAIIAQPTDGQIFLPSFEITFVSGSYDVDDVLSSWTWDFNGETVGSGETDTHSFVSGGPKTISLTIQDGRNEVNETEVTILVDSPDNDPPAAIISQPRYGEVFSGLLVTFDARSSVDDLTAFDDLIFHWDFDDGSTYEKTGAGGGAYFTKLFATSGEKTVRLTVTDGEGLSSEEEVIFSIKGCEVPLNGGSEFIPVGSCSVQSKHYFCKDESTWYDTLVENCEGADGLARTIDDCCPRGYFCSAVGAACLERETSCEAYSDQSGCEDVGCVWLGSSCVDPLSMSSCSDYQTQQACNDDILALGRIGGTGLGTDICGQTFGEYIVNASSCRCEWDGGESACKFVYETNSIIGGDQFISCLKSFGITECLEGIQTLTWTATCQDGGTGECGTAEGEEQCNSGQKEVKCGAPVSKLGFFSFFNLITASLILAIYYIFLVREGKRKKDNKGK